MIQVAVKILNEKDFYQQHELWSRRFCRAFRIFSSLRHNPIALAVAFSFMFLTLGVHKSIGVS